MDRLVEHRGCRLSYSVVGSGPPVLFIQGVGVHGSGWRPQTADLAADYTCVWFDNRGIGKSQPFGADVSVAQMADDAKAILDAERIPAAHVVGHSLGGPVALQLALNVRDRVKSLSLLCSFAGSRTAAPLTLRMIWLGLRSRIGTRSMRRNGFLQLVLPPGARADPEALADLFGHDLADQPPIVNAQLRALRSADLSSRLSELAGLPALVVSATHDPIAPPSSGRALSQGLGGAPYVEVADASHGLPITHAALVNSLLREHFAAAETASAATWETCQADFAFDGALIDLLVPGTDDADWEVVWTALRSGPFEVQAFRDGEPIPLPDSARWAIAERDVASVLSTVRSGTIHVNCHFFGGEVELDIDPREIVGPAEFESVLAIMRVVAAATCLPVFAAGEGAGAERAFLSVSPNGQAVRL